MQPLGELLPALLRELGLESGVHGWRAVAEWPEVVGERLSRRSRALRWCEGTLWVEVDGSVWMYELSLLKRALREKLNAHLGGEQVKDLHFVPPRGGSLR